LEDAFRGALIFEEVVERLTNDTPQQQLKRMHNKTKR